MAFESGIDLSTFQSDYLDSSDWNILNTTAERKIMPADSNDTATTYSVLTFEINMKRKLVFSSYILTLPCVFLACLTLVVFWLPPDRPDRTALGRLIHVFLFSCSQPFSTKSMLDRYFSFISFPLSYFFEISNFIFQETTQYFNGRTNGGI